MAAADVTNMAPKDYPAPEMLLDEAGYTNMVHFWSLGASVFEMRCGWSPFRGRCRRNNRVEPRSSGHQCYHCHYHHSSPRSGPKNEETAPVTAARPRQKTTTLTPAAPTASLNPAACCSPKLTAEEDDAAASKAPGDDEDDAALAVAAEEQVVGEFLPTQQTPPAAPAAPAVPKTPVAPKTPAGSKALKAPPIIPPPL
ncbi:serine/threonine-protein kinase sck1 [Apiospora saccharicola]|uniref:Serine/threonine-protein kinase sck1 n=1 Tax=Apiospora saccharicola TaxID=335842 RepID=A0ABR1W3F0_9PEZI